jgi:hypothetical protein
MRILLSEVVGYLLCRLTNDFQTAHKGSIQRFIARKLGFGLLRRMIHQVLSRIEDVLQERQCRA